MLLKVWIQKPLMLVLYPWFVLGCICVQLIPYWYKMEFYFTSFQHLSSFTELLPIVLSSIVIVPLSTNQINVEVCVVFTEKNSHGTEFFFTVVNVSFLFYSKTVKVSFFVFPPFINTTTLHSFIFLVQHSSTFPWCCDTFIHTYFLSCKKFCNKVT